MKRLPFPAVILLCMLLSGCGAVPAQPPTAIETVAVLTDADPEAVTETTTIPPTTEPEIQFDYTICFTGDISAADGARTTSRWITHDRDTSSCFDETIMQHMQNADICFANNEFPYSTRGSVTPGKEYTYRADPQNVQLMLDLGVDIVSLANNHMYDYGPDALLDTLDTLDNAHSSHRGRQRSGGCLPNRIHGTGRSENRLSQRQPRGVGGADQGCDCGFPRRIPDG